MNPSLKVATAICGVVGTLMITAATVSPTDLDTNVASWLSLLGWENPPRALISSNADRAVLGIGIALLAAAILGIWGLVMSRKTKGVPDSTGGESSFIRGKVKNLNLENNYSSADNFVDADVQSLSAKFNIHEPGGEKRPAWQRIQKWFGKDRG